MCGPGACGVVLGCLGFCLCLGLVGSCGCAQLAAVVWLALFFVFIEWAWISRRSRLTFHLGALTGDGTAIAQRPMVVEVLQFMLCSLAAWLLRWL